MSLGRNIRFVGHEIHHISEPNFKSLPQIDNIIYKTTIEELKWAEEATYKIGEWRDIFRSTYIRWALAINGLHQASKTYSDPKWRRSGKKFIVTGFRMRNEVQIVDAPIAKWDGNVAADAHLKSVNMIASYGIIDLYSCFEELIFDFYKSYLKHKPDVFLVGPANKDFRKIYNNRESDPEAWNSAFEERLGNWQRKKLYESLPQVFLSYMNTVGLEKPKDYEHTSPETWVETLKGIAILRNCLTHGQKFVPEDLAEISKKPYSMGFNFKVGEEINLSTKHLMSVELFGDQLLRALNISIIEKAEKEKIKYINK
ncbi:hypothetical protein [Pontibacter lucknowensis]|uniref:Uncharacterized protein n=1 Tax=Pontibacter lucknowensis TaxID=1077936 RepID=A0A1N7A0D8_9BACT|nr:hypothetical protein [Pontibacter lucknowensis]SIR32473.1 hypothetical protein SAMN05421545_3134 [Pontibacter lucknowensis]